MKVTCRKRKDSVFVKVDPLMVELKRLNLLAVTQTKHAERKVLLLHCGLYAITFHLMKRKLSEETLLWRGLLNEERRGRNKGRVGHLCLCSAD